MDGARAKRGQDEQAKPPATGAFVLSRGSLDRARGEPVYRQIYLTIKEAILAGTFPDGARLPSSRSLATQLGLSRTTVDLAYNLLAGDGLVLGRTARGTLVTSGGRRNAPAERSRVGEEARELQPLDPDGAAIDLFPRKAWCRLATRHAKTLLPEDMVPHDPAGHPRLREAIANRVRLVRGLSCDAEQVFVTAGSAGALMLIGLAQGHRREVLADERALWSGARRGLEVLGRRILPLSFENQSICTPPPAGLAVCCAGDFAFSGEPWDDGTRDKLAEWAREHDAWLVEDDRDMDLYLDGPQHAVLPRSRAGDRSIYLGSFERSLFPEVGCSFVVVPHQMVDRFAEASVAQPLRVPFPLQRTLCDFIIQGYIGRHANRLRRAHAERRKLALAALRKGSLTRSLRFEGAGSYLVASLAGWPRPEAAAEALAHARLGARIVRRAPGEALLVVGYAAAARDRLAAAIARLDDVLSGALR